MNQEFQLHPEIASTFAYEVDLLYFFVVAVSVIFMALICILIYIFAVKYRRRTPDQQAEAQTHGNLRRSISFGWLWRPKHTVILCLVLCDIIASE